MANEFLSQDEVDALLKGVGSEDKQAPGPDPDNGVREFKLGAQERVVRRRMPTLDAINNRMVQSMKACLFELLRQRVSVSVKPVQTVAYEPFVQNFSSPSSLNIVQLKPLRGSSLFIFEPALVHIVVDTLFGGNGSPNTRRATLEFTPIEKRIIHHLLSIVLAEYQKCWLPVHPVNFEYVRSESHTQFSVIANPLDVVAVTSFNIETDSGGGALHICIPYSSLEPIADTLSAGVQREGTETASGWLHTMRDQLQNTEVDLVVNFTHIPVSIQQILNMNSGDVISVDLPRRVVAEVEGVPIFSCHYGTSNGKYSLKVDKTLTVLQEGNMLGGQHV